MNDETHSNCIGYAYHTLGLTPIETYLDPPPLSVLLEDFQPVPDTALPVAIAVTYTYNSGGPDEYPEVIHMAVIDHCDPVIIHHRRGFNLPAVSEPKDQGLQAFLQNGLELHLSPQVLLLALKEPID